jgi:hypothetical protein
MLVGICIESTITDGSARRCHAEYVGHLMLESPQIIIAKHMGMLCGDG